MAENRGWRAGGGEVASGEEPGCEPIKLLDPFRKGLSGIENTTIFEKFHVRLPQSFEFDLKL